MNGLIVNDATFSGGMTFLVGELEKLDPVVRQPLTSVTYPRDVRIIRGTLMNDSKKKPKIKETVYSNFISKDSPQEEENPYDLIFKKYHGGK